MKKFYVNVIFLNSWATCLGRRGRVVLGSTWLAFKPAAWSPLVQRAHEVRDFLLIFRFLSEQTTQSRSFRPSSVFSLTCGFTLLPVLHTHFPPYSCFPPEKWVYTSFSPGKISIYSSFPLIFRGEIWVYTEVSPSYSILPLCTDRLYKGNNSYKGVDPMETFVELLMLKKKDHLYFSLYVILFEILANDCSLTPMFYL